MQGPGQEGKTLLWLRFWQPERVGIYTARENAELEEQIFDSSPVTFLCVKFKRGPKFSGPQILYLPCGD